MKIKKINSIVKNKKNRFIIIKDIINGRNIMQILDNKTFAKESCKSYFDETTGVTVNITCKYIGYINGVAAYEWKFVNSCGPNSITEDSFIGDKNLDVISTEKYENRKIK